VPVIVEQYRLNELKFTATLVDFKNWLFFSCFKS
jgi:hypothetical protein